MKILVLSTNGIITDGITSWLVQNLGLMDKTDLVVDTVAFEGVSHDLLDRLAAASVGVHILPIRKKQPARYFCALRRLVRERRYDVIHINGNSATVALELMCCVGTAAKRRVVHSHNTRAGHTHLDRVLRPLMRWLLTDRFACGTEAGKWLFGEMSFVVIPNGRDFATYAFRMTERIRARERLRLADDEIAIGHVGNFTEQKNHRFLIDAFARAHTLNSRLRLFLLGDGVLRPEIEQRAADLGVADSVRFVGYSSRVADYLNAFDAAVLPSLYEGLPNVVVEWQVNGLPSLISSSVSDECAMTDLVEILPADDLNVWASAIASVGFTDRDAASAAAKETLREAGYEAHDAAAKLRERYLALGSGIGIPVPDGSRGPWTSERRTRVVSPVSSRRGSRQA